jgi:2-amino-4-hydroxy-6-hydroxymethyldihydropteridine diphosphokinase
MNGKKVTAYIGLGSNIGDRQENLDRAIELLKNDPDIKVKAISDYINTSPVGYIDQPDFLNAVVELETSLSPHELLKACNNIEQELKRKRIIHWGPRTIDLDILLYGDLITEGEELVIPHPRMHEREFVLKPLNEIAPEALHPVLNRKINELYEDYKKQTANDHSKEQI